MTLPKNQKIQQAIQQATILCQSGQFTQARDLLCNLHKKKHRSAQSCFILGTIYGQMNEFDRTIQCYQEAIKLDTNQPQVHFALGKACQQLGNLCEAELAFSNALKLQPDAVQTALELAIVLFSQNKLEAANEYFSQVIKADPASTKALFGLGRIYQMQSKLDIARTYFEKAIQIDPKLVSAHYFLGKLLFDLAQLDAAEKQYKKVLKLHPGDVHAFMGLGYLNIVQNRVEDAKSWFEKVLATNKNDLNAIAGLAKVYDQMGELQQAYDLLKPNINKHTNSPDIGIAFANICRHFDSCPQAAEYLEQVLSCTQDDTINARQIHFSLGKIYDRLKEYDKAFLHFDQGNKLKTDIFNSIEEAACIVTLIKTCDWNYFIQSPKSTQNTDRIIFIVGMPRSGTTLTEQILASHPDLFGVGEVGILPGIIKDLPEYLGKGSAYPGNLKNLTTDILNKFSERYLKEINQLNAKSKRVVDKTLANYLYLGLISQMFPNAKIIHCKRDPRDTCLSIYFQNFDDSHYYATRLKNLGEYYKLYEKVMAHWKSLIGIPIYEVQYEELVANQEKISRELIDFVELEWDDRVLEFYKAKRSVITASYDQVRQKMYTKSTARWKNYEKHLEPLIRALDL